MLFWPATLTHAKRQLNNQFGFLNALRRGFGVAAIGRVRQQEPAFGGIGGAMIKKIGPLRRQRELSENANPPKELCEMLHCIALQCNANASRKAIQRADGKIVGQSVCRCAIINTCKDANILLH